MQSQYNLEQWFLNEPFGKYLLNQEYIFYHKMLPNIFGYYALQLNLPNIKLLTSSKIINQFSLGKDFLAQTEILPFASDSIDLIICPHLLEFYPNYLDILTECKRILTPQGRLLIMGFNPKSSLYLFKAKYPALKHLNFIEPLQLQETIQKLQLQLCGGEFISYKLACLSPKALAKYNSIEKIGNRWFAPWANSYSIICSKLATPLDPLLDTEALDSPESLELTQNIGIPACNTTQM